MTFKQLKDRIISTLYLPLWLRDGITQVAPTVIQPKIEPAPEGTPKWCPYVRAMAVSLSPDGARAVRSPTSKNRNVYLQKDAEGVVKVIGSSIESAYCIGDRCMMWDAKHTTCGLRNPILQVEDAVVEAQAIHKALYPDQYPAPSTDPAP